MTPIPWAVVAVLAGPVAKQEVSATERAALQAWRQAMKAGRVATRAEDWDAAVAAFDQAATFPAGAAQAISERGYARLLAGRLEEAGKDLDTAADRTADRKLLGQIWFNRGLIAEKQGHVDEAMRDFVISNQHRPTPAAGKRVAGATTCGVEVETEAGTAPVVVADWLAVATTLGKDDPGLPELADAAAARTWLCREHPCTGTGPFIVDGEWSQGLVFVMPGGALKLYAGFRRPQGARCGFDGDELEAVEGDPRQFAETVRVPGYPEYTCFDEKGRQLRDDADSSAPGVVCQSACFEPEMITRRRLFFDAEGRRVLAVGYEQEALKFVRAGGVLKIEGPSCRVELPIP